MTNFGYLLWPVERCAYIFTAALLAQFICHIYIRNIEIEQQK